MKSVSLLFAILSFYCIQCYIFEDDDDDDALCATKDPSLPVVDNLRLAIQAFNEKERQGIFAERSGPITVPVCFSVMMNRRGNNVLGRAEMRDQLDHLNRAFSSQSCCTNSTYCSVGDCSQETGFRFAWALVDKRKNEILDGATSESIYGGNRCTFWYQRPLWVTTSSIEALFMKRKTRKGDMKVLNVWWSQPKRRFAAYATFPDNPRLIKTFDGVVITPSRIRGAREDLERHEGDLLVHEVGHWLGLRHTFANGCDAVSDGIADTPKEYSPFRGCGELPGYPVFRDSCPHNEGSDPVHNFMDYSSELCQFEFSPGQVVTMKAAWEAFRGDSVIPIKLNANSSSILLPRQTRQIFSMAALGPIRCTARSEEGRMQLALRWDRKPRFRRLIDNCVATSNDDSHVSCTARFKRNLSVLYAAVRSGSRPIYNLTVSCEPYDPHGH